MGRILIRSCQTLKMKKHTINKKTMYTVIQKCSQEELVAEINKMLEDGWICQGGVATTYAGFNTNFYQAMVRI